MRKESKRNKIYGWLTVAVFLAAVLFSIFRFAPVFGRLLQAIKDLALSIAYYFLFMFELEELVTPTIGIFPENLDTVLPLTFEELELLFVTFWDMLFDAENVRKYMEVVGDVLYNISQFLMILIFPFFSLYITFLLLYKSVDNDYNVDSKQLRGYKAFERSVIEPIFVFLRGYLVYLKERKWLRRAIIILWHYNLNFVTMLVEALAWFFFFTVSYSMEATLVTIAKLFVDFMVSVIFIPGWLWAIFLFKLYNKWRRRVGGRRTYGAIDKVVSILKRYPGPKFINGKMRSKKTSLLTQFLLLTECYIFRPKAKELLLIRDKQFPNFPRIVVDRFILQARAEHKLYTWSGVKRFFKILRWADLKSGTWTLDFKVRVDRALRKFWGYEFEDYCFGYDRNKYPSYFDDALKNHSIFDAVESYVKLFMLYSQLTSLMQTTYSVRSDFYFESYGNFPEFVGDLVSLNTAQSEACSSYSHIMNWDRHRLGDRFNPAAKDNNSIEYVVNGSAEHDKERKNQVTKNAVKKVEGEPNQDNDFVPMDIKMHGHIATVDNFSFVDWSLDAQRTSDLSATEKDLTVMMYIKNSGELNCFLPFFEFDEVFYLITTKLYDSIYSYVRKYKGSNTLLIYLLRKLYTFEFRYYIRLLNRFAWNDLHVKITDGGDGELMEEIVIPLIWIVAYRDRFATDSNGDFYYEKIKNSPMGLDDTPMYSEVRMTMDEMLFQNSYFIKDLTQTFNGKNNMQKDEKKSMKKKP